jgi:hypothetical protein
MQIEYRKTYWKSAHKKKFLKKKKKKKPSIPFYWESAKQIPIYNDSKDDLWNLNLSYVNPRQK